MIDPSVKSLLSFRESVCGEGEFFEGCLSSEGRLRSEGCLSSEGRLVG